MHFSASHFILFLQISYHFSTCIIYSIFNSYQKSTEKHRGVHTQREHSQLAAARHHAIETMPR